jgi:hypothetical protein
MSCAGFAKCAFGQMRVYLIDTLAALRRAASIGNRNVSRRCAAETRTAKSLGRTISDLRGALDIVSGRVWKHAIAVLFLSPLSTAIPQRTVSYEFIDGGRTTIKMFRNSHTLFANLVSGGYIAIMIGDRHGE